MGLSKKDLETIRQIAQEVAETAVNAALGALVRSQALSVRPPSEPEDEPVDEPSFMPERGGRSALAIDNIVDQLEHEGYAGAAVGYQKRRDVGMSKSLAEVKTRLAEGFDLTPNAFVLPSPASYFKSMPRFQEFFIKIVEDEPDVTLDDAYERTCVQFNLPPMRKAEERYKSVLSELPAKPRGAFLKGREEAEAGIFSGGLGRLLGRGKREDEE